MGQKRVVGLCGSLRDESKTRVAAKKVMKAARDEGASVTLVDLRSYNLPAFEPGNGVEDSRDLREGMDNADSILLATPNYHGSYSGVLKNALDYCGRDEFAGKTVGLVEVAGGRFPGSALVHLRIVSRTLKAWTLPNEVRIPSSEVTIADGTVTDEDISERIDRLGRDLVRYANVEGKEEKRRGDDKGSNCTDL